MAHAFLESMIPEAQVLSAGTHPQGVHPYALQAIQEVGIDISHYSSNHVAEYTEIPFDYIITVCDNAKEKCPIFLGGGKKIHHSFPDPAEAQGEEKEIFNEFRRVRNMIQVYCENFIQNINQNNK